MITREPFRGEVEETPLACACALGFLEIVKMLIDAGANANYKCSVSCLWHIKIFSVFRICH